MNARCEATAFRLWVHCRAIGWNCTIADAARALDLPVTHVRAVVVTKGWSDRFRSVQLENSASFRQAVDQIRRTDEDLDPLGFQATHGNEPAALNFEGAR